MAHATPRSARAPWLEAIGSSPSHHRAAFIRACCIVAQAAAAIGFDRTALEATQHLAGNGGQGRSLPAVEPAQRFGQGVLAPDQQRLDLALAGVGQAQGDGAAVAPGLALDQLCLCAAIEQADGDWLRLAKDLGQTVDRQYGSATCWYMYS